MIVIVNDAWNITQFYLLLSLQMDRKFLESLRSDEQPANTRVTVLCKQGAVSLLKCSIHILNLFILSLICLQSVD
jgi:hypothetical protein